MSLLRGVIASLAVLVVLTLAACERAPHDPGELGVVAAQIHAEPDREAEILDRHGLTREEFDARVWDISEDPEAARRYTEAMERELENSDDAARR